MHAAGIGACLIWLGVQITYLIGSKQRVTTPLFWAVSFVESGCAERVIKFQILTTQMKIQDNDQRLPDISNTASLQMTVFLAVRL